MLNNQPMGFYSPATLVKDAQRHGLKVRPIDITRSEWLCTLERVQTNRSGDQANGESPEGFAVRLGLRYVKGLREDIGQEIARERGRRAFSSIEDLKLRVPKIQKTELTALAEIGALNPIAGAPRGHRRDALWQVERAARRAGELFEAESRNVESVATIEEVEPQGLKTTETNSLMSRLSLGRSGQEPRPPNEGAALDDNSMNSPLAAMSVEERLVADFRGTGMTVGPHPMAYHRSRLKAQGIRSAIELQNLPNGIPVRVAGSVIARQRPGTAHGFVFLSLEDETGISNAIITPQLFQRDHVAIVHQQFLLIEGVLQNQENVISVKAASVKPLQITQAQTESHDFH